MNDLINKFKEKWIREQGDLQTDQWVCGYYIVGLLLEVLDETPTEAKGKGYSEAVEALKKIALMSDPGSAERAVIEMKIIASNALSSLPPASIEQEKWVRVEDGLPEINLDVIVCNAKDEWVVCGYYTGTSWYNTFDESGCRIRPTHWQPLPTPPIEQR